MKPKLALLAAILVMLAGVYALRVWLQVGRPQKPPRPVSTESTSDLPALECKRIVSMAPSITEVLFAVGLGDNVVGVTRYCDHPVEAQAIAQIGGYFDPSYETIVQLEPDVVMLLPEHHQHREHLERLGLQTFVVKQTSVEDILASISGIGSACGVSARARELVADLRARTEAIERRTTGMPRPGVLVSVGRQWGGGVIKDVFVAGKGTFMDELVGLAGGTNVYERGVIAYPTMSSEGILSLNPQVIIEITPELEERGLSDEAVIRDWDSLPGIHAVRDGRVHVFTDHFAVVPGPRYVMLLAKLARVIHPEFDWDEP